jgi:hypothetical protein
MEKDLAKTIEDIGAVLEKASQSLKELYNLENDICRNLWQKIPLPFCEKVFLLAVPYKGRLIGIVQGRYGYLSVDDIVFINPKKVNELKEPYLCEYVNIYPFEWLGLEERKELVEFFPTYVQEIYNYVKEKGYDKLEKLKPLKTKLEECLTVLNAETS